MLDRSSIQEANSAGESETPPLLHGDGIGDDSEAVRWYAAGRLQLPPGIYRVTPLKAPAACALPQEGM
jgi:hypothetical protein